MKTFTIRVDDSIKEQLKIACSANATTPSQIARKLVTDWVNSQGYAVSASCLTKENQNEKYSNQRLSI